MKKIKTGYSFERAVYEFASRLDAKAEVLFDHKVPDKDTGTLRQCDVWINAKLGGHWPISVLVSCKDHGRKLDVGDIGNFCNEVMSTRASTGIIYARSGFTKPALDKAKANGLSCCRLYLNEPGELPQSVELVCFLSNPRIGLSINPIRESPSGLQFDFIFNIPVTLPNEQTGVVLDLILSQFYAHSHEAAIEAQQVDRLPESWQSKIDLGNSDSHFSCTIRVYGSWRHYKGKPKATLLNGSYCLTNDSYAGWFVSPGIHNYNANPGDNWEEIDENTPFPVNALIIVMNRDIRQLVIDHFGPQVITGNEDNETLCLAD